MPFDFEKINQRLLEVLSSENGYFGYEPTFGQTTNEYEPIGHELTDDIIPALQKMSDDQKSSLVTIINYFEINACPLKELLDKKTNRKLAQPFYEIAWSHFMTLVMFGMLEVAVKTSNCAKYNKSGFLLKGESITCFLETNLPSELKKKIAEVYFAKKVFNNKKEVKNFSDVIYYLWSQIRSGFVHEAKFNSIGLNSVIFYGGMGLENDPIKLQSDVPMYEWLQITWRAILNSYGYQGTLTNSRYNTTNKHERK